MTLACSSFWQKVTPNKQRAGDSNFLHCCSAMYQSLSFGALNCGHKSCPIRGALSIPALCARGSRNAPGGKAVKCGAASLMPVVQRND